VICLLDNDIIHKLAACDLVEDALTALGLDFGDVLVLPTAKHKFGLTKNTPKAEARYGVEVFARIRALLEGVQEIDIELPAKEMQLLSDVEGIDTGEVVLFAATAYLDTAVLATGDKRSLRALALAPSCRPIALRIGPRVLCLEQIIRIVIGYFGFPQIRDKILPARSCDTSLRAVFGSGAEATEMNVLVGLDNYIVELRSLPVNLLIP
jgi:hypothetical protein